MANNFNFLKSKKLPIGVFAGIKRAPAPARIFIDLKYSEKWAFLLYVKGVKTTPKDADASNCRLLTFEIPVTPPTIQIDFGNSKDTENVTRIGEVVLPKYKKAMQFRWESFFPYDLSAKYLNTTVRNLSFESLKKYKEQAQEMYSDVQDALKGIERVTPTPALYINIFNILSQTEEPFTISMKFYDGGNLDCFDVTLDSFNTEPENNGDYKYNISLVEWTDISPKLLDGDGNVVRRGEENVDDGTATAQITGLAKFWKFVKQCYGVASKALVFAFATYNGIRNLAFDGILKAWKIKGALQGLAGRFGILSNMFGLPKITSKDTKFVSDSLKKLSFTKASKQMAEFLNQNKMYRS